MAEDSPPYLFGRVYAYIRPVVDKMSKMWNIDC